MIMRDRKGPSSYIIGSIIVLMIFSLVRLAEITKIFAANFGNRCQAPTPNQQTRSTLYGQSCLRKALSVYTQKSPS